jgi:pimeloyl-ACP methyl ester carboxylesterase
MADYVHIDVVRMWYDVRGEGDPLVLLHGGLTDSRDFAGNLATLADRWRVYLPERRGHGHTADVAGPLTLGAMAQDTIGFLERVVGQPAQVVGYSAGAMVALRVALARPDLVAKLVLISGAYSAEGMLVRPSAAGEPPAALVESYASVSPDGAEHFPVVLAKVARAAEEEPGLSLAVRALHQPGRSISGRRSRTHDHAYPPRQAHLTTLGRRRSVRPAPGRSDDAGAPGSRTSGRVASYPLGIGSEPYVNPTERVVETLWPAVARRDSSGCGPRRTPVHARLARLYPRREYRTARRDPPR